MKPIHSSLALAFVALASLRCASPPPPVTPARAEPGTARPVLADVAVPERLPGGSSDGVTCEEARDSHPDEIGIGAKNADGAEPADAQFEDPLAHGTYLNDCNVPEQTHVSVCAAVVDGKAAGVTVATEPSDPDKEHCVSARIREIQFPSHKRLRVVRTSF